MNARMRVNRALGQSFQVTGGSSNTLQGRDREHTEPLHSGSLDVTVQAIAHGTDPRLVWTLARP